MSRYEWKKENLSFAIGWDPPLKTFFAQIHDDSIPEESDKDNCIVWLGADYKAQFPELSGLLSEFEPHLNGENLPEVLKLHLNADKEGFKGWLKDFPLPEYIKKISD